MQRNCLAIDVGGSSIKYALVSETGGIGGEGLVPTPPTLEGFYQALVRIKEKFSKMSLAGAGFSLPGAVDAYSGIIGGSSSVPYIHGFNLKAMLRSRLSLPVAMENDANCAGLGEVWLGAAQGKSSVIFLVCGSGIGGAVIKDGRIHRGANLHGGEFGYMIARPGPTGRQTLSEIAAPVKVARRLGLRKGLADFSAKKMYELADQGDTDALAALLEMYMALGTAVYNLQYAYDPEVFIIGGGVSAREDFIAGIQKAADQVLATVPDAKIRPQVLPCKFGNNANLLGAARNLFLSL